MIKSNEGHVEMRGNLLDLLIDATAVANAIYDVTNERYPGLTNILLEPIIHILEGNPLPAESKKSVDLTMFENILRGMEDGD